MKQIKCCYPCKPPKRHPGCHETCPEYKKERQLLDEDNNFRSMAHFIDSLEPKAKIPVWKNNKR